MNRNKEKASDELDVIKNKNEKMALGRIGMWEELGGG